mmetsp:Transcript_28125/g.65703  ORF Transcript_28125/g.65703 Transcript_28125/m.65703 type:complete len:325 (-) Transcript_28125:541-1515(-)
MRTPAARRDEVAPRVVEVEPPAVGGVHLAVATRVGAARPLVRRVVAAAVDDAGAEIDERVVVDAAAVVDPRFEHVHVVARLPIGGDDIVRLHLGDPEVLAGDPLDLWVGLGAHHVGRGAEVDVVQVRLAQRLRLGADEVVELAEVAHARRLDGAAPPPAAALHISPWPLASGRSVRRVGASTRRQASDVARLPEARPVVGHVEAASSRHQLVLARPLVDRALHVRDVVRRVREDLWRHVGGGVGRPVVDLTAGHRTEGLGKQLVLVPRGARVWAPAVVVPPRHVVDLAPWRAEERSGCSIPLCGGGGDLGHGVVHGAFHICTAD